MSANQQEYPHKSCPLPQIWEKGKETFPSPQLEEGVGG